MAEVNELFDKITDEQSYFDPSSEKKLDTKKFEPIRNGDYYGHITSVDTKILDVKRDGNYKARMYKYVVTVAPENEQMQYTRVDKDGNSSQYNGKCYVGLKFTGTLWRFLEPKDGDDFDSNSGGNKGYMRFCETIGVECPTHTKTVDGQDVEMKALPNLTSKDMLGQPVIAFIAEGRAYTDKNGFKRNYRDCKFVKEWKNGEKMDVSNLGNTVDKEVKKARDNDEIPF